MATLISLSPGIRADGRNELHNPGDAALRGDAASARASAGPGGEVREGREGSRRRGGPALCAAGCWPRW